MKFLLDENADHRLVAFLTSLHHDVKTIGQDFPSSLLDHEVLAIATREKRVLITNDRADFGELIFRQHLPHSGIILFRLKSDEANIRLKQERLRHVLTEYSDRLQHFLVVTTQRVKIREAPLHKPAKNAA
jgi:predicted nuclease of predicted toxin-antitoxin system